MNNHAKIFNSIKVSPEIIAHVDKVFEKISYCHRFSQIQDIDKPCPKKCERCEYVSKQKNIMSDRTTNFEGIEMSHLSLFMLQLSSAQNEDKEDDFFYAFVKYIREGNEIDTAIHLAELELDHDG